MLNVCPSAFALLQRVVARPGRHTTELGLLAPERNLRRWRVRLVEVGFVRARRKQILWPTSMGSRVSRCRTERLHRLPDSYRYPGLTPRAWQVASAVVQLPEHPLKDHPLLRGLECKVVRRSRDIAWAHGLLERIGGHAFRVRATAEAVEWFQWWDGQSQAAAK